MGRSKKKGASRTRRVLTGVLLLTVAILLALALGARIDSLRGGASGELDVGARASRIDEIVGWFGSFVAVPISNVAGLWVGVLLPLVGALLGLRLLAGRPIPGTSGRVLLFATGAALLASASAALVFERDPTSRALYAGAVGPIALETFRAIFGRAGAVVVLGGAWSAFGLAIGFSDARVVAWLRSVLGRAGVFAGTRALSAARALREDLEEGKKTRRAPGPAARAAAPLERKPPVLAERGGDVDDDGDDGDREIDAGEWVGDAAPAIAIVRPSGDDEAAARAAVPVVVLPSRGEPQEPRLDPGPSSIELLQAIQTDPEVPYQTPPEDFLEADAEESSGAAHEELLANAKVLEKALRDFGVKGKVTQVQPGPVITRFEIEPAAGQKVAPIANLSDDLALALKARHIRIVAPIPGKAAVGIEIPNPRHATVRLGPLLQSAQYKNDSSPLNIALGRTISGDPYCAALDRMPHVLVAGATGAGKSVCINTIITSIIYRAGPERVRFIMIDPKMLELMSYVGLPHLVPPVVTQPKEASKILKWVVAEMETRYRTLAHAGVRNIVDYNRRQEEEGAPHLPYLVTIVDELADLMLSSLRSEIEESIARLAQMARAVGIHLVVATQRPSVDVITGVIKANFPSRIAFQVPTRIDSRTILDSMGAERLLGRGDMLYLGVGMAAPLRIHGSYVSTEETTDIVEWLKTRHPRTDGFGEGGPADEGFDPYPRERDDDLFEESARIIVAHQQGSVSLLQRRLKVGYARAARLVDMLEEAGVVGAFTGSKAREVLVPSLEELEKKLASNRQAAADSKPGR